jgi:hypothetical protein
MHFHGKRVQRILCATDRSEQPIVGNKSAAAHPLF